MLRKFAAVLLATTLVAGPAFAASPSGSAGSTAPAATAPVPIAAAKTVKPAKTVVHARKHIRKHVAHAKVGTKMARHVHATKSHRSHAAHVVAHIAKPAPAKINKNAKGAKSTS